MAGGKVSELSSDWQTLPTSRDAARVAGVKFYFNGKPCRWSRHVAPRYVSTNSCVVCQAAASKRVADKDRPAFRAKSRENYARNRESRLARQRARYWSNVEESRRKNLEKYYANHESNKQRSRALRQANPERYREYSRLNRHRNKGRISEYNRQYKEANRHIYAAAQKAREMQQKRAMPAWVDREEIKTYYEEARRLTLKTGMKYEVDHIIPLQGITVSGLHVPWNLQVIPKVQNVRKSNRLIEAAE